jgi:hypothetical protein
MQLVSFLMALEPFAAFQALNRAHSLYGESASRKPLGLVKRISS